MKKHASGLLVLAVFGTALIGSPALAKCGKDCKSAIRSEHKTCKAACAKGSGGKACRTTCSSEKKADMAACKAATNPTPPGCGEAS